MSEFKLEKEVDGTAVLSLEELTDRIYSWGYDRGITVNGKPISQTLKLGSEFGELCDNIAKGRHEKAKDDIGDMFVVLCMISKLIGSDMRECVEVGYLDIKDRGGYLNSEGIFIKEGDNG